MSAVTITGLTKAYGRQKALNDVSLEVKSGEFYALLGPSGCGKTTLLRAIAGFVTPDAGRISIAGEDMAGVPVARREIGLMFQNYALFPHLSVRENLGFGLAVRHRPKAGIAARVDELLALVRLEAYGDRRPRELSGGQQQRVALARALAPNPRILLLDEPLGALDKALREEMQFELKQIQRRLGITTIFVTHDQEEALTLSDRIAILNGGQLEQSGRPRDLYERPESLFAARFLGGANILPARAEGREAGLTRLRLADGSLILSQDPALPGEELHLAVRPEKIGLVPGGQNQLQAKVTHEVFSGTSVVLHLQFQEHRLSVFVRNAGHDLPQAGDAVTLSFAPEHVILLRR